MDDENAISVKAVLLGESGVGKTCIISRFINNIFENNIMTTTGASYAGKTMTFDEFGGKSIKFEIWDTAGQEKYRSLTKIFYKDAGIAILVYDITRQDSFDEIKSYWYSQIKDCAPKNIIIGIAANKCDLYDVEQVSEDEARNFASDIGAVFKLTSANTNIGIDELFKGLGCRVFDPNYSDDSVGYLKKNNSNIKLDDQKTKEKKKKACC